MVIKKDELTKRAEEKGIQVKDLDKKIGRRVVSSDYFYRICFKRKGKCSARLLGDVARVLGCNIEDIGEFEKRASIKARDYILIKDLMKKKGFKSLGALSESIGCSDAWADAVLYHGKAVHEKTAKKFSDALGVELQDVFKTVEVYY